MKVRLAIVVVVIVIPPFRWWVTEEYECAPPTVSDVTRTVVTNVLDHLWRWAIARSIPEVWNVCGIVVGPIEETIWLEHNDDNNDEDALVCGSGGRFWKPYSAVVVVSVRCRQRLCSMPWSDSIVVEL